MYTFGICPFKICHLGGHKYRALLLPFSFAVHPAMSRARFNSLSFFAPAADPAPCTSGQTELLCLFAEVHAFVPPEVSGPVHEMALFNSV